MTAKTLCPSPAAPGRAAAEASAEGAQRPADSINSGGGLTASFEELVYIDGEEKRILGRANLSEVGTLPAL